MTLVPDSCEDTSGRLTRDLPCVYCSYNLRGLWRRDACPECGRPVSKSLCGFELCMAPRAWLRGLYRGFVLLEISFAALLFIPLPCFVLLVWEDDITNGTCVLTLLLVAVAGAAILAAAVLSFVGMIMVTRREPRLAGRGRESAAAGLTRWLACLLALSVAVSIIATAPGLSSRIAIVAQRIVSACVIPLLLAVLGLSYTWFVSGMVSRASVFRVEINRAVFWVFVSFLACSLLYGVALVLNAITGTWGGVVATLFLIELLMVLVSLWAIFATTRKMRRVLGRILRTP